MRLTLDEMLAQYPTEMAELATTMRNLYTRAVTSRSYDVDVEEGQEFSTRVTSFFANRLGGAQPVTDAEFLQSFDGYEASDLCLSANVRPTWGDVWRSRGQHGHAYTYYFDQIFMGWCWRGL